MNSRGEEIFIESILPIGQRNESVLFEMTFADEAGKKHRSRFYVRNCNVGLFNLAINSIRPAKAPDSISSASHITPRGQARTSSGRAPNNPGGQSCLQQPRR